MKRLFFILLSVLLVFGSCVEFNDDYTASLSNQEIVFTPNINHQISTRAVVEDQNLNDNFGVYGYVEQQTYSTGGYLMRNGKYDKYGKSLGNKYYWPASDNNATVHFIFTAYTQFEDNVDFDNTTGNITLTIPELTQDLINNPDSLNDVMWAQTLVDRHADSHTHYSNPTPVELRFHHTLSFIKFRAEVADTTSINWVKIKSIRFSQDSVEYSPEIPGIPYQAAIPETYDTTDTWMNLRRGTNFDGSPTKTSTDGGVNYVDNFEIPAALVAEIKSYYSINGGTAGDYDMHMGATAWPSAEIRKLRVVKEIPAAYKRYYGDVAFFDALKYLQDNGYKMAPRTTGGKPAIFDYPIIDLFVNGTAYTIAGFNYSVSNVYDANVGGNIPAIEYIIDTIPGTPEVPAVDPIPASLTAGSLDSLYVTGKLVLPTKDTIKNADSIFVETDTLTKVPSFEFAPNGDTIPGGDLKILSQAVIVPQAVPSNITIVFDICTHNESGDTIITYDRVVTRKINSGNDMSDPAKQYVNYWGPAHKYIYNFRINTHELIFNVSVDNVWNSSNDYSVWY